MKYENLVHINKNKWKSMVIYVKWTTENNIKYWYSGPNNTFYFSNKSDAVLFQLAWG